MSLNQLQFAGMPAAQPRSVGEKSRPAPVPTEPHGDSPEIKGEYNDDTGHYDSHGGQWTHHDDIGVGIKHIAPGKYNPERQYRTDWEQDPVRTEVPIQNANGPVVWSHQEAVSRNRLDQLERAPHTAGTEDVPTGAVNPLGEVALYDGNHRTTQALRQNQMFQTMDIHRIDQPRRH